MIETPPPYPEIVSGYAFTSLEAAEWAVPMPGPERAG